MNDSIAYLSASELRRLYSAKALSPVEVTRAILDRIERLNPMLNAFTVITAELALNKRARRSEPTPRETRRRWRAYRPRSRT